MSSNFSAFKHHPLIRNGHAQTIAGAYLLTRRVVRGARQHVVTLADGDQIVVHDDCPEGWQPSARVALLIHGLAGSHASAYMQRAAAKLGSRGVRVFRLDLRGCGAGLALARLPYHSGRSEDAAAAIEFIEKLCPGSRLTLIGYSLGGNIALKLLGELGEGACGGLDSGIAVCPPIDLAQCAERISSRSNCLYDRHFVRMLERSVAVKRRLRSDVPALPAGPRPRTLRDFDELYTAPVSGFGTAENYYRLASARPRLGDIRRPTLIVAADDDPMIPCELFRDLPQSDNVQIHVTRGGGHLGFIASGGADPDRRWLDWRILDWTLAMEATAR